MPCYVSAPPSREVRCRPHPRASCTAETEPYRVCRRAVNVSQATAAWHFLSSVRRRSGNCVDDDYTHQCPPRLQLQAELVVHSNEDGWSGRRRQRKNAWAG